MQIGEFSFIPGGLGRSLGLLAASWSKPALAGHCVKAEPGCALCPGLIPAAGRWPTHAVAPAGSLIATDGSIAGDLAKLAQQVVLVGCGGGRHTAKVAGATAAHRGGRVKP
jgi:hypothetical protein